MGDDDWDRVLRINLFGSFHGAREAAGRMIAAGRGGVIINMASTSAFIGSPTGLVHYTASKHGIAGLTKSLAVELGPYGIRVLCLAPTRVHTEGLADRALAPEDEAQRAAFAAAGIGGQKEVVESALPLGRAGVPDDVARVALFCASDLSMLMTGAVLPVDAGALAG
jgi:NAD(P)-dependent dehydrogenase (short-subunit alcohol dehydrogenase family)